MEQRIRIGKWTTFSFAIILWIISIVALVLAFGENNKKTVLIISIFGTLCMLIISIAFLYYMWGIAALSGGCNVAKEIIKGNAKILEDINAPADFKIFVNQCLFNNDETVYTAEEL